MIYSYKDPLRLDDCSVSYIGYWDSDTVGAFVEEHLHGRFYEFTIITSGFGKIYTSSQATEVKAGDIYISFPFDIHKIESDPGSIMKYSFISLSINSLKFSRAFDAINTDSSISSKRVVYDPEILNIINEIIAEAGHNDAIFSNENISCLIREMMIRILRGLNFTMNPTNTSENSDICRKIMGYIDDNLYNIQNLSDVAEHFGYNYSYLSALFKKTTKITMACYYRSKRLEMAKLLLVDKGISITKAAEFMNYTSVYSFSKSFREHYGVSPRKYLQQFSNKGV